MARVCIDREEPMKRFHKDAIPYDETLARLNRAFILKPGDVITHDQLRAVIQAESESRYRGVLAAWKRQVAREGAVILSGEGRARGIGLMVCSPQEESNLHINHGYRGARKIKRSVKGLDDVETSSFSPEELNRHNIARRYMSEAAAATNKFRNIPPPKAPQPTQSDNVRLFKENK